MESTDVGEERNQKEKAIDTETTENTIDLITVKKSIEKEMLENETKEKENANTEQNPEKLVLNDDFCKAFNKVEKANDDVEATNENLLEKRNENLDKIIDLTEINANEKLIKDDKSNTQEMFCEDGNISKANEFEKDTEQPDTKSSQDIKNENKNDDNAVDHEDTTPSIEKLADAVDSEKSTDQNKIEIPSTDMKTAVKYQNTTATTASDPNFVLNYSSADEDISLAELSHNDLKLSQNQLHTPLIVLDESTADSLKTTANSTDSETRNLKSICLTRSVKILVHRLRAEDLTVLRQPKVKLKRVNVERYAEELQAKRRRTTGRGKSQFF